MLIGWSRSCLCLAVLIHLARSNFNHNCTNSTCEDVTKPTDHLRLERIKRAATAQCSASSNDLAHSLVDQICCDATLPLFVDNQLSTNDGMGAISRAVQTRMQARFNTSFEVIISETDFVVNTYYSGPRLCKFETNRYFVAVYETPVQYDIGNLQAEYRLASVDSRDPLGWKQAPFAETSEEISAVDESAQVEPQQLPPPVVPSEPAAGPSPPRTSASGTTGGASRPRRPFSPSASCSARSQTGALPYAFSSNECCDGTLRNIMLNAASRSIATPHLGDAAKYIQRRIQLQYGQSYEVIISRENFAVSTHYHGTSSCKIRSGSYYFLAYSTPVQYDPFNIAQEDLLASTDSEEPLGSTRYTNLRGDLPDVRVEPAAGDDLSIQPSPEQARAAIFEGAGGPARTARQRRPVSMDTEEDTGDERTLTVLDGFHVGGNRSLGHVTSRDEQDFPPGSHCDRDNRSGNMCCDSKLFQTITDAFYDLSSSPQFAFGRAGNIASLIQKRIQQRFSQSFEVFVSSDDFAMASYYKGDQICKYQERGFTVMAYATTVQYDTTNTAAESFYSSISYRDPLGATEPSLPGMRAPHTPLALYGEGGRAGFPVGSHCGESRAGSKCCNLPLFNVMTTSYESVINRPDFDPYDTRLLARTIQWNAEEMLGMSLEVVISSDDFAFSTSYGGDAVCKYRIDRYHIMAYASPVQYPIHTDFYEDSGPAEPLNCPNDLKALSGAVCCDGILQYEMTRLIDQTVANQPADQRDQQSIARAIQRNIQRRFGTTFESIAAKSDFVWSTNLYNENTCKLNAGGYHLLTVESSKEPPPIEDFIDAVPPMPFNAEPSFQPEALQPPQLFQPPPVQAPPQAVAQPPVAPQAAPAPFAAPPAAAPAFAPVPPAAPAAAPAAFFAPPAFAAAGGGGGGGGCFSTDTWVTTPNGKKRMDQLKVGDFILTANSTAAYFAPMSLWIHREPDVVMKFVTIMTDYGKMLALTPRHLIFRTDCEEYYDDRVDNLPPNSQAVYAEELHVGDCVFLLYKNKFRLQKLMDISITSRRGVFSPLTPNGRIIVNDMLASCYSDVNEATLQTTYFSVLTSIRKRLYGFLGSWIDSSVDLPYGSDFSMELLRLIVPYVK